MAERPLSESLCRLPRISVRFGVLANHLKNSELASCDRAKECTVRRRWRAYVRESFEPRRWTSTRIVIWPERSDGER